MTDPSTSTGLGPTATFRSVLLGDRRVIVATVGTPGASNALIATDGAILQQAVDTAIRQRVPFCLVIETVGVAAEQGIGASVAWGRAARALAMASGVVPTFAVAAGPVLSGPALLLGLVDVVVFTTEANAYVTGPRSVETYTGVPTSAEELGGVASHLRSTGLASLVAADVDSALELVGDVLGYLPDGVDELPPRLETGDDPNRATPEAGDLLPAGAQGSYDVRDVVTALCDDGIFLELRAGWAPNLVIGFCAFDGHPVGVVANQTQALAGSIDIPAAQKGARFVAMCDAFNVPLVTMVDTSGFLPGKDLEWRGMIRHGAQMAFAYARATVPRIGLILRKSFGGAYIVMDSKNMGNDLMLAWPSAEVAVMGAKGAVEILHRKAEPEQRSALVAEYESTFLTPYPAAERQSINTIVTPHETRGVLCAALNMLSSKRERLRPRRHDNGPL